MGITADSQLDIVRDLNLDHGRLVVHELLDGNNDLVDIFAVDLLASLEPLDHVVNELLCHLVAQSHAVIARLDNHRVEVKPLGRGRLIADLNSGKECQLSDNLLAFFQLESCILVVRIEANAGLEVVDGLLGSQDRSLG